MSDLNHRFLFDQTSVRGQLVKLSDSYSTVLGNHDYPADIQVLLGEFMSAAALLSSILKFDGRLILQIKGQNRLKLLVAECEDQKYLRAIARINDEAKIDAPMIAGAQLVITIQPHKGKQYQGIVQLETDDPVNALESYFRQSEQLTTRLWLAADSHQAAGLLLQTLPSDESSPEESDENWNHLETLTDTIHKSELLQLDAETILHRLYHEQNVTIFNPAALNFRCQCSKDRSSNALLLLGEADSFDLLETQETITIDCQFCHQTYEFDEAALNDLFHSTRH